MRGIVEEPAMDGRLGQDEGSHQLGILERGKQCAVRPIRMANEVCALKLKRADQMD